MGLHYVYGLWGYQWRRSHADGSVVGFQHHAELLLDDLVHHQAARHRLFGDKILPHWSATPRPNPGNAK
jgi:hypothetical protein